MRRGIFPRRFYPGVPIPFDKDQAINSDSDAVFDTIQGAIDAVTSGGWVSVGPGTYTENVTITTSDIVVRGAGRATVVDGVDDHALEVQADDVTLADLAAQTTAGGGNNADPFHFEPSAGTLANPTLLNPVVLDSDDRGIQFIDCDRPETYHPRIRNCDVQGFRVEDSDAGVLVGGRFLGDVGDHAIMGSESGQTVADWQILGPTIEGPGNNGIFWEGDRLTVTGHVNNPGADGIVIQGGNCVLEGGSYQGATGGNFDIEAGGSTVSTDLRISNTQFSSLNAGTRTILNDRYVSPPTLDLSVSTEPSVTDNDLPHYTLLVDAGGAARSLIGLTGIAEEGTRATLRQTGGEDVTLAHNDGGATNPLLNTSLGPEVLDANDEMALYEFDGTNWRQLASNVA